MCKLSYKLHSINAKDKVLLDNGSLLPLMEEFYTIYVVDDSNTLQGVVSIKNIIKAHANAKIKSILKDKTFLNLINSNYVDMILN